MESAIDDTVTVDAFLADSVVVADGKLSALGAGWNLIGTPVLPVRHPRIGIGVILGFGYGQTLRAHEFEIRLEDADGRERSLTGAWGQGGRVGGTIQVDRPAGLVPGDEQLKCLAFNIDGVVFDRADRYRIVLSVNGVDRKTLPFRVNHFPAEL